MRRAVKSELYGGSGGDSIASYREFQLKHPDFVKSEDLLLGVICVQSAFMAKLPFLELDAAGPVLVESWTSDASDGSTITTGPLSGLVSDAAHKYWKTMADILIITSIYCMGTRCWIPILMSWSLGQSSDHYAVHFLTLFTSIYAEAKARQLEVLDEWFANVRMNLQVNQLSPT
jgi:hypothetical protein